MSRFTGIVLLTVLLFSGCEEKKPDFDQSRMVTFEGRHIDLQPYVEGFPYSGFTPFYEAGKLFYYHRGETTQLKSVDLAGQIDLQAGKVISDIDFATRNVWNKKFREADGSLYWTGDQRNDEVINLYRLDPATKAIEKLTDVPYIFGGSWDESERHYAYVARLSDKADRLGEVRVLDLESGDEKKILQDNPQFRFTWGNPGWQPSGKGFVVSVLKNADRTYGNLAYIDLSSGKMQLITDPDIARSWPGVEDKWLSDHEFLYYSNEDGFNNAYYYNLKTRRGRQLTRFKRNLSDARLLEIDGKKRLFVVLSNPIENDLVIIEPTTGEELFREKSDLNVSILDSEENRLLVSTNSASSMFNISEITVAGNLISWRTVVDMPETLKKQILHAAVERIEYPTFDEDPATGQPRLLHAFLYKPIKPRKDGRKMAIIESFYGGSNSFRNRTQIFAEAGIYVLSPAPRGSSGFGREFMGLNDKDLGGNEIIDIIYAGKYLQNELGFDADRIGVIGGSHGGYATMRLLTFPGEINGNKAHFDWGFGISHAGFSDIIHFYENCNIPDWVILEAGDPVKEADKLRDRSPLYHADKIVGKLLLTHGTNDKRVPIEGSRWMADSLRKYDKPVTLVEFDGQGHGIKGLANTVRYYKTLFEFLENLD